MAYDNTNSGLLAKNTRKEKDTHPAYTGSINVDGKDYWISAWVKEGREGTKLEGQKYFSLSVKPKEDQIPGYGDIPGRRSYVEKAKQPEQRATAQRRDAGKSLAEMDDDIPF